MLLACLVAVEKERGASRCDARNGSSLGFTARLDGGERELTSWAWRGRVPAGSRRLLRVCWHASSLRSVR